jgi:hypothetical protein
MLLLATGNGDEGYQQNDGNQNANKLFQDLSPFAGVKRRISDNGTF